jgi:hypothetical protein
MPAQHPEPLGQREQHPDPFGRRDVNSRANAALKPKAMATRAAAPGPRRPTRPASWAC